MKTLKTKIDSFSFVFLIVGSLFLLSCNDILEPDITHEKVQLLVPVDSSSISKAEINFRWEELKGASSYRLQLASPSFLKPEQYFNDTVVTNLSLVIPLQPGNYEWRVQALNAGYKTGFTSRSFQLDSASNLSGAEIRLLSPANNFFNNSQRVSFSWAPIELADKYIYEIVKPIKFDTVVYGTSLRKSFPKETKTYEWRVRALNKTGAITSGVRTFTLDFEAPNEPNALYPEADTVISSWPVTLKWRRTATDVANDSLYLFQSDQHKYVNGFPKKLANSVYVLSPNPSLAPGSYYWSVKSFDRAGNSSSQTTKRKFTVR